MLVGLFFLLKPKTQTTMPPSSGQNTLNPATEQPSPTMAPTSYELVIQGKKLVSGPTTIKVNQGDEVTIKITSDEADTFHLHGYDKSVAITSNTPAQLIITANLSGRFEYELEKSGVSLGQLEVMPK